MADVLGSVPADPEGLGCACLGAPTAQPQGLARCWPSHGARPASGERNPETLIFLSAW